MSNYTVSDALKLDRKTPENLSSAQQEVFNYFSKHGAKYGLSINTVSLASPQAKEEFPADAIEALYKKEVRVALTDEMTQFLPFNTAAWLSLGENLNKTLFEDTQGQFRRKTSWLRSRIAKSLPYTAEGFNENTLVSQLKGSESNLNLPDDVLRWAYSYELADLDQLDIYDFSNLPSVNRVKVFNIIRTLGDSCTELNLTQDDSDSDGFEYTIWLAGHDGTDEEPHQSYKSEEDMLIDAFNLIINNELSFSYTAEKGDGNLNWENLTKDILNEAHVPSSLYTDKDISRAVVSGYKPLEQVAYIIQKGTSPKNTAVNQVKQMAPVITEEQNLLNEFIMNSECGVLNFLSDNADAISRAIVDTVNETHDHRENLGAYLNQEDWLISLWMDELSASLKSRVESGDYEMRGALMDWANSTSNMQLLNEAANTYLTGRDKKQPLTQQLTLSACYALREVVFNGVYAFFSDIGSECVDEIESEDGMKSIVTRSLEGGYIKNSLLERANRKISLFHVV